MRCRHAWPATLALAACIVGAAHGDLRAGQQGSAPSAPASGGGAFQPPVDRLTDAERQAIQQQLDQSIEALMGQGAIRQAASTPTPLAWPLAPAPQLGDYGYSAKSAFPDHGASTQVRDYQCGTRSYDGHRGSDFYSWPFGWLKMDHDLVWVVAAAPGTIVSRSDGHADRSCAVSSAPWNAVFVRHANGSVAWYGHLKSGSLTAKAVGDTVAAGEYLGVVGSSGSSTGPHLHFELHDDTGAVVDPFAGACNTPAAGAWWTSQPAYYDSTINALTTGPAPPSMGTCPSPEQPNSQAVFTPGSRIYFTTYYRDQMAGQTTTYTIRRPDGTVYSTWPHTSPSTYNSSYWYWSRDNVAPSGPAGVWRFEAAYQSQTYVQAFTIGEPFVDTDADGLPDAWEAQSGLVPSSAAGDNGASGDPDGDGKSNLEEYDAGTHPRGFVARYFAEGATIGQFDTVFALLNPSGIAAHAQLRFLALDGTVVQHWLAVPGHTRRTVTARDVAGLAGAEFSTVIESDVLLVADRTMSWDASGFGGHAESAITAPSPVWYLAEGATHSGFDLFVLIANPNDQAAQVRVTYLLTGGQTYSRTLSAPPNSRSNIWVDIESFDGVPGHPLADVAVSTTVASENGVPVIVERALWWPGDFSTWHEAHNSPGATQTATRWALAEGEVAGARAEDTYILVANTSSFAGEALVTLYFEDGTSAERRYTLPANSRTNAAIAADFGDVVLGKRFGAVITSLGTQPAQIVVERAMYWNASGVTWAAGTNTLATRLP